MSIESMARTAVSRVTIRTTATPDFVVEDPFGPVPQHERSPSILGPLLGILRPSVYVEGPGTTLPIEPWGKPESKYAPFLMGAAALVIGGIGYLAVRGLLDVLKKRR